MKRKRYVASAGCEVEVSVSANGEPLDFKTLLVTQHKGIVTVPLSGTIVGELGEHQAELVTTTFTRPYEVTSKLNALDCALRQVLPIGSTVAYEPYCQCAPTFASLRDHPHQSSRVLAQLSALGIECVREGLDPEGLVTIARANSTHVHVQPSTWHGEEPEYDDPDFFEDCLLLRNLFSNCATYWATHMCRATDAADDPRQRFGCWFNQHPGRWPQSDWILTRTAYERHMTTMPRLVRRVSNDMWEIDLEPAMDAYDSAVQKSCRDYGRFTPYHTVEARMFPSMQPRDVYILVETLLTLVEEALAYRVEHQITHTDHIYTLYTHLRSRVGDFMPREPLTREQWLELANLSYVEYGTLAA